MRQVPAMVAFFVARHVCLGMVTRWLLRRGNPYTYVG